MTHRAKRHQAGWFTNTKSQVSRLRTLSQDQSVVKKWFWVVLLAFYAVYFVSYIYPDIIYTTFSSINFWNGLLDGRVWDFHNYSGNSLYSSAVYPGMAEHPMAIYPLPLYLIFAVWDLPLWFADRFLGVDVFASFWCLLWIKLMLLLFLVVVVKAFYELCLAVQMQQKYILPAIFLFLSSYMVMSPLLGTTQYDIITMAFLMFGLVAYFKGKLRTAYLYFSLAIIMKLFALFVIIPLFLLQEKRILRVVRDIVLLCIPTALFYLLIVLTTQYGFSGTMDVTNTMVANSLFSGRLDLGFAQLVLFPAVYLVLCIWCYAKAPPTPERLPLAAMHIAAIAFSAFFLFSPAHPYWVILLAPYITILAFMEDSRVRVNLLMLAAANTALAIWQGMMFYWCYSTDCISRMLPALLLGPLEPALDFRNLFAGATDASLITSIAFTVFFVCLVFFLALNRPGGPPLAPTNSKQTLRGLIGLSAALSIGVQAVPLLLFIFGHAR